MGPPRQPALPLTVPTFRLTIPSHHLAETTSEANEGNLVSSSQTNGDVRPAREELLCVGMFYVCSCMVACMCLCMRTRTLSGVCADP